MNVLPVTPAAPPPPKTVGQPGFEDQFSDALSEVRKQTADDTTDVDRTTPDRDRPSARSTDTATGPADADAGQTTTAEAATSDGAHSQADTASPSNAGSDMPQQPGTGGQQTTTGQPAVAPAAAAVQGPDQAGNPASGPETATATTAKPANVAAAQPSVDANTPPPVASNAATGQKPAAERTDARPAGKPVGQAAPGTQTLGAPTPSTPSMAAADADTGRSAATSASPPPAPGTTTSAVPAFAGATTGNTTAPTATGQAAGPQGSITGQAQAELPQVQNLAKADLATPTPAPAGAGQHAVDAAMGSGSTTATAGIGATGTSETNGGTQTQTTAASPSRPAANMQGPTMQVAVQIARAAQDGVNQIQIRLNPAELGRVDVRMDVGHDGRVIAVVTADRQETLDLLQRDQRSLERALQDAGLQTGSGGLSFSLRHDGADARQTATQADNAAEAETDAAGDTADNAGPASASRPDGILDISV